MFATTSVFHANYNSTKKVIINQGGTYSSKTHSIIQVLYLRAIEQPQTIITITGESVPNLKKGAYRDAQRIYNQSPELQSYVSSWNQTDRHILFKNGSLIEFTTNMDEQTARSGKRDFLFVNEAQGVPYNIFFQLALRTSKQVFVDYNPTAPFWAHDNLIGTEPHSNDLSATVELIISDHRHNTFLSPDEHAKIEGIKDRDLWLVYARGKTGNLTGTIYSDWTAIPPDDFPTDTPLFGGLDWGYTNDPTAGTKLTYHREALFVHELCYTPGLSPPDIATLFTASGLSGPIYCDHDPQMIALCRREGLLALPAVKGTGSIMAGILKMKATKVYYTSSSVNLREELKRYVFVNDRITGKPSNTPIDMYNHALDSARMGYFSHFANLL